VALRRHTLLPLDDCLYALEGTIPHLTRSSLHRCLQRHGIGRLPDVEGDRLAKKKFKAYPIGYLHIDIAEPQTAEGKLYLYAAIDRTSNIRLRPGRSERRSNFRVGVPYGSHRSDALQDRQRHPVHLSAPQCRRPAGSLRHVQVRYALPAERDRASPDQGEASLDHG
jgi:hypothetical protein